MVFRDVGWGNAGTRHRTIWPRHRRCFRHHEIPHQLHHCRSIMLSNIIEFRYFRDKSHSRRLWDTLYARIRLYVKMLKSITAAESLHINTIQIPKVSKLIRRKHFFELSNIQPLSHPWLTRLLHHWRRHLQPIPCLRQKLPTCVRQCIVNNTQQTNDLISVSNYASLVLV